MSLRKVNASFHSSITPRKFYHYFICSFAVMNCAFETFNSEFIERVYKDEIGEEWPLHDPFIHFYNYKTQESDVAFFTANEKFSLPPSTILYYR